MGANTVERVVKLERRKKIVGLEKLMRSSKESFVGEELDKHCPLKHTFADGLYIREVFMPAGDIIVTKLHKTTHPFFIMKGKAIIVTDEKTEFIEAPYQGITRPGTKRAFQIIEDVILITVHITNETDLEKIEKELIVREDVECIGKRQKFLENLPKK